MSRWRRWIKKRRKKFARHCPLFFSTLPAFLLSPNCYFGGEIDPTQINEIYNKSNNIQLKKRVSLMASLFHDQNLSWGACKTRDIRILKKICILFGTSLTVEYRGRDTWDCYLLRGALVIITV